MAYHGAIEPKACFRHGQGDVQVWPGAVHYPDFMKPSAVAWWGAFIEVRANLPGQACDADICVG